MRRVIELATPHLVAHWPERIQTVVLATGEPPEADWLRSFRAQLRRASLQVMVVPAFGYVSEQAMGGGMIRRRVIDGIMEMLRELRHDKLVVWAHNLGLGRNLYLARELTLRCRRAGIPLVMHHHDWWFENRWHHFASMRDPGFRTLPAVANAILAGSPWICHVAINQTDAHVLSRHFCGLAQWMPNPIASPAEPPPTRVDAARAWLRQQLGEEAPMWLLPCRLLRRKNIAEALLLTRWLRPGAWLVTTGGASSAEEQAYAGTLDLAARTQGWRLRLGMLQGNEDRKPSVRELLAVSEAVLFTSLQEGFGLPALESAAAQRPLVARLLPNIAPDLAKFGFRFPQCYREVRVDPSLFDWRAERKRQKQLFARWKGLMPATAAKLAGKPVLLAADDESCPVPFSRLTLTAQLEVLSQPVERSWNRCAPLNPFLEKWREQASAKQLAVTPWPRSASKWISGGAFARRFLGLVPSRVSRVPPPNASRAAQAEFVRAKLRAENLYPLLWDFCT